MGSCEAAFNPRAPTRKSRVTGRSWKNLLSPCYARRFWEITSGSGTRCQLPITCNLSSSARLVYGSAQLDAATLRSPLGFRAHPGGPGLPFEALEALQPVLAFYLYLPRLKERVDEPTQLL